MAINIDATKKQKILELIKSLKAIDSMIIPFQEQRKELRTEYIEQGWLSSEEFSLVKKAYNFRKNQTDIDDLSIVSDVVKEEMP